jgi:hypothetical protein
VRHGRFVTLLAVTGGALWLAAAPASAITISIGGSNPTLPIPVSLPLPIGATVSTGTDGAPLAVNVTAPAATQVGVQAGPTTGLQTDVGIGNLPPVALHVATPSVPGVPAVPDAPKLSLPSALPTTDVITGHDRAGRVAARLHGAKCKSSPVCRNRGGCLRGRVWTGRFCNWHVCQSADPEIGQRK